jgi:hypothetical protein
MDTYAQRAMSAALVVLLDSRMAAEERTDAAWVVRGLWSRWLMTEALVADIGHALKCNLDAPGALARLLVVLRAPGVDASRTANAVGQATALAFRRGHIRGLHTLLLAALDDPAWFEIARDDYGAAVFAWAISDLPARRTEAVMLLSVWIRLQDAVPSWASSELRRRPELIALLRPPTLMAWRLHSSAPTAGSWRFIVTSCGVADLVTRESFGESIELALETLGEAIAQEPDDAARVVLASWLSRLAG